MDDTLSRVIGNFCVVRSHVSFSDVSCLCPHSRRYGSFPKESIRSRCIESLLDVDWHMQHYRRFICCLLVDWWVNPSRFEFHLPGIGWPYTLRRRLVLVPPSYTPLLGCQRCGINLNLLYWQLCASKRMCIARCQSKLPPASLLWTIVWRSWWRVESRERERELFYLYKGVLRSDIPYR